MFISPRGKAAPAVVIANPRVASPQQARTSGKPVVFLFGNIHPPESEAAETLHMVMATSPPAAGRTCSTTRSSSSRRSPAMLCASWSRGRQRPAARIRREA
jgi:hypothetical protein